MVIALGAIAFAVAQGARSAPPAALPAAPANAAVIFHAAPPAALAATPDPKSPLGPSVPVHLVIPAIDVDTTLMRLGLLKDGSLEVPPDGFPAGWFDGAPTPGELGPAVIAGHVDYTSGPAVFYDLHRLKKGDLVDVTRADGSTVQFAVTKVGQYPKNEFPTEAVYGPIGHAGLRLITCGGSWDASVHHYRDNVVVFATIVTSTPAELPVP